MAAQTIKAVFQDGIFRPLAGTPSLTEGQHVQLVVEVDSANDVLELAGQVFDGLSEEARDVERIAFDRGNF